MSPSLSPFSWTWFLPTWDAFTAPIPFSQRWRLLVFQPFLLVIYIIKAVPLLLNRPYSVIYIPSRRPNAKLKTLVFQPPFRPLSPTSTPERPFQKTRLRPLHIHIHGGGFIGGIPEADVPFCTFLSARTGAVVVAISYRFAPRHSFPAAIDDVDDSISWLIGNAEQELNATPNLLTISGFSAGGNLALAASQSGIEIQRPSKTAIKAAVVFYPLLDTRLKQEEKRPAPEIPKNDPAKFLFPLFNSYAEPVRQSSSSDPRLNPVIASVESLPEDILIVTPSIDILVDEQDALYKRVKAGVEPERLERTSNSASGLDGKERRIEQIVMKGQMHGWVELPEVFIDVQTKKDCFDTSASFIRATHQKYGYYFS